MDNKPVFMKIANEYFQGKELLPNMPCLCLTGPVCPPFVLLARKWVFLERFHHKEAYFSRSQAAEIGDVFIREEFETRTAAW